jgi:hypothetical protein
MRLPSCANIEEPPGVLGNHELAVEAETALTDLVEDDLDRHGLGHAGGHRRLVRVLLEQDGARIGVHEDGLRSQGLKALRPRVRGDEHKPECKEAETGAAAPD